MRHYRLNDQTPLKTKRLLLSPMSEAELTERISALENDLLRSAYLEMRRCVVAFPDQALWHTSWRMTLRETKQTIGFLGFHGTPADKTVELGYDVAEEYRGNGFAAEATKALSDWAFLQEGVYFIRAMTGEKNEDSNRILEKLRFYRIESPIEGKAYWELERPASAWMPIYMCIGLGAGLALGSTFYGSQTLGMIIGLGAGLALGASLDTKDRVARKREAEPKKLNLQKTKTD